MGGYGGITQYKLVYKALAGDMSAFSELDQVTWVSVLGMALWYQEG